jgi:glycosyltransferase involved in cell wall biosynthesis
MRAGGAERVVSVLANSFAENKYRVAIIVSNNEESFYPLDKEVYYEKMNLDFNIKGVIKKIKVNISEISEMIKYLKRERPEVVISFIRNVPTIIACKVTGIKVIISERNNPKHDPPNPVWRVLRRLVYPLANGIVFQTESAKKYFNKIIQNKSHIISNPLNPNLFDIKSRDKENIIVSIGRLVEQKDHETLIKAFSLIKDIFPEFKLYIYGEGKLRRHLEYLISQYGLEKRVYLPGNTENIYYELSGAKLFVFTSIYEGYPNALIESMALGIPVISTNCEFGPSEIIEDGENGFLVSVRNHEELAKKIEYVLNNQELAQKISENAIKIKKELQIKDIFKKWKYVVDKVVEDVF